MKMKRMGQGALLGVLTGLLATFFDSMFMLLPDVYVPPAYPLVLLGFNLLFWCLWGAAAGFALGLCLRRSQETATVNAAWIAVYVVPFALLYGFLGRVPLPHMTIIMRIHDPVFDHHLSFVWVGILLASGMAWRYRRPLMPSSNPLHLWVEIFFCMSIFHFCANPKILNVSILTSRVSTEVGLDAAVLLYAVGILAAGGLYAGYLRWLWPWCVRRASHAVTWSLVSVTLITLVGCYGLSAQRARPSAVQRPQPADAFTPVMPHVIVLVVDTLRAQSLDVLLQAGDLPAFEQLSRDSLQFTNCHSPAQWTLPSHASLFTGVYPPEHGCDRLHAPPLDDRFVTLAEVFKSYGYATAAVASNYGWLNHEINTLQGFDLTSSQQNIGVVHKLPFRPLLVSFSYLAHVYPKAIIAYRRADDINALIYRILPQLRQTPSFLFVNYMDVHSPYRASRPYDRLFVDAAFPQLYRLQQYYQQYTKRSSTPAWDAYILSQYHAEIVAFDRQLGRFFSYLKENGMYDSSLIVVTSDHGEVFGGHGYYEHYTAMHEGAIKIPLFVKFPHNARTGAVDQLINLTDLYPTLLELCAMAVPADISSTAFGDPRTSGIGAADGHRVLNDGRFKYMDPFKGIGSPELYDLAADPFERTNLIAQDPETARRLLNRLDAWSRAHPRRFPEPAGDAGRISSRLRERLKTLGYMR